MSKQQESKSILEVRNLRTYFYQDEGIVRAVDDASFDVQAGRTLGIVGESGCGKSVMARSILNIVDKPGRIVGGEILLHRSEQPGDETIVDIAQLKPTSAAMRSIRGNEIALIFQEPMTSFSSHYTIGSQIIEALRLHNPIGKREARTRAIDLLREVGVPEPERRIDDYAFQMSGGLRQRVMIAMALSCSPKILSPKILIADEPTTALDVTTQAQILELLTNLQEATDMAVIMITHDMGVIAEVADEVAVMYLGRVVEFGTVDDIFHAPKHPYTQSLLRSIPSIMAPPRTKLPTITGAVPHPYNRPRGCPFHPRCADRIPGICDRLNPEFLPVNPHHSVRCFLHHSPDEVHNLDS